MATRLVSGPPIGVKYREVSYDPESGKTWRVGASLEPDLARLIIPLIEDYDVSASGILNRLARKVLQDPDLLTEFMAGLASEPGHPEQLDLHQEAC